MKHRRTSLFHGPSGVDEKSINVSSFETKCSFLGNLCWSTRDCGFHRCIGYEVSSLSHFQLRVTLADIDERTQVMRNLLTSPFDIHLSFYHLYHSLYLSVFTIPLYPPHLHQNENASLPVECRYERNFTSRLLRFENLRSPLTDIASTLFFIEIYPLSSFRTGAKVSVTARR